MTSVLDIDAIALRDDSIIKKEIYPYAPYTTAYGESEEIRIAIQSKDGLLLPCESYIYVQITCTTGAGHVANEAETYFVNNFCPFLFSSIRYELNGITIDSVRDVGRATTMKLTAASRTSSMFGYAQLCKSMETTSPRSENIANTKKYDLFIPLEALFPFCDDYRKIILNCKHELILNRARQSLDCTAGGVLNHAIISVGIDKIEWKMVHCTLSDAVRLKMLNYLAKNRRILVQYRSMDLMQYPNLPESNSITWSVKTLTQHHRPRYILVGLQSARNGVHVANAAKFDSCHITSMKVHLNSQIFPYNMNTLNIGGGFYAELFNAYASMQSSYYNGTEAMNPFNMNYSVFQRSPLFVFDTSRTDESIIDSAIDVRIEINASENIPANTAAYCLLIYDNEFTYSPFDSIVLRSV